MHSHNPIRVGNQASQVGQLKPAATQQHPQGMRTGQGGLAFKQLSSNRQIGILNSGDCLMSRQCANHKAFMTEGREHLR